MKEGAHLKIGLSIAALAFRWTRRLRDAARNASVLPSSVPAISHVNGLSDAFGNRSTTFMARMRESAARNTWSCLESAYLSDDAARKTGSANSPNSARNPKIRTDPW